VGAFLIRANLVCSFALLIAFCGAFAPHRAFADDGNQSQNKANKELPAPVLSLLSQKSMPRRSPILVRIFKEESELEVWKQDNSGRFELLKVYPICRWSGDLGPKINEGDRQAPEGFYSITPGLMNPNSNYYLAINIGFPNAYDRANDRHGAFLMIHGDCSSRGCYAMTDEQIAEIYALAREAFAGGQPSFQIQAYPFRMTPMNLARHRTSPHLAFWKMLKVGNDHFEATHLEPKVDVCDKQYVFDAQQLPSGARPLAFESNTKCPAFVVNAHIARAALEKQHADEVQYDLLVKANTPVEPIHSGVDGGMNRVFLAQVGGRLPPARSTGAQGTTQADNNGSFTSKLLGFFGWKSSSQTEVAANTAAERVSPQVTGTTPKIKPTPPVSGGPNIAAVELGKEVSGKMDEVQQRDPVAERDAWSQEAALTFSQVRGGNDASSPRHTDSFDSRWNGLRGIAEPSVTFKTRWALESQ
jgi:murein L,D-transpeptidase YafK